MELTPEQIEIRDTDLEIGESLCVEAGAGTGKTTCFIEYAKNRPEKKMLYLCFNNKASKEAQERFEKQGIKNVSTSTIHGLAGKVKKRYEDAGKFCTKVSIKDLEKKIGYSSKLSWLILETIKNFCYSQDEKITKDHTPTIISKEDKGVELLVKEAQNVWKRMISIKDTMPLSYDHYLKVFQLSQPRLNYDYILLDEAQDSNPLTLSILERQKEKTRTILIGDENQAIYSWRGAKNAMRAWDATKKKSLTESFRFGSKVAKLANAILGAYPEGSPRIKGTNKEDRIYFCPKETQKQTTFIARTNATLFEKAIELQKQGLKCHFVNTQKEDGWDPSTAYKLNDLKDVYRLWSGNPQQVESPLIKVFKNYHELRAIAIGKPTGKLGAPNSHGDKELEFLCKLVEKYQHALPTIVQTIKDQASGPPSSPEDKVVVLCTAHRAKGLEWDNIQLGNDFIELSKVLRNKDDTTKASVFESEEGYQSYMEEINLLYVACTRAKSSLMVNEDLARICIQENIEICQIPEASTPQLRVTKAFTENPTIEPKKNNLEPTLYLTI
jgi:F-box protein 18 (helicase)